MVISWATGRFKHGVRCAESDSRGYPQPWRVDAECFAWCLG